MTKVIKVNCRKLGISLLATLWTVSSFLALLGSYLAYETVQSYDKNGDCHFNYVENRKLCQSVWEKNHNAYGGDGPATSDRFQGVEMFFDIIFSLIQVGAFIILNAWKHWVKIECSNHTVKGETRLD